MTRFNTIVVDNPVTGVVEVITPGPQGIPGPPGDLVVYTAEAIEPILAGQPIFLQSSGIHGAGLAASTDGARAKVFGFCIQNVGAGGLCQFVGYGKIEVFDWTAIFGSESLEKGRQVYLGETPGTIVQTPPGAQGTYLVKVGWAVHPKALNIEIQPSIFL